MGHGVGHDADAALLGGLVGDGGLADARRAHEQQGTLGHLGDGQVPKVVPGQVGLDGLFQLGFGFFHIHSGCTSVSSSGPRITFMAQGGTLVS